MLTKQQVISAIKSMPERFDTSQMFDSYKKNREKQEEKIIMPLY
jgi:hypothetical protein